MRLMVWILGAIAAGCVPDATDDLVQAAATGPALASGAYVPATHDDDIGVDRLHLSIEDGSVVLVMGDEVESWPLTEPITNVTWTVMCGDADGITVREWLIDAPPLALPQGLRSVALWSDPCDPGVLRVGLSRGVEAGPEVFRFRHVAS